ncbi:Metallo-dependent phosphatase-like protein [Mycotypha africana]|uniref:Metallo-dependent phosphatase-like protein n=1 Tax=Mycotypha africana TaxID=64632 RepID=UPI00230080DB|nr:Metallo-dependent phosphatase-like protein [Mycotypha africana]KAI8987756.1 Metallo-dependent phosphatase-like protein [Mycotypha africana]
MTNITQTHLEYGLETKEALSQYQDQQLKHSETDIPSTQKLSLTDFLSKRKKHLIFFTIATVLIVIVAIAVPLSLIQARNQHLHDGSALSSISSKSVMDPDNENSATNSTSNTSSQSPTPSPPYPSIDTESLDNRNRTNNGTVPYREFTTLITLPDEQQQSLHPPHYAHPISPYANLIRIKQLYPATNSRIFIMGDIHGCLTEMNKLLDKVHFQPNSKDILIIAGDLVFRGEDSIGVIRKARELGAYCVRGNHDDKVVRLKTYEMQHSASEMAVHPAEDVLPEGNVHDPLKFGNKHLQIAKNMNVDDYNYLAGCPLVLDIPDLNARIVHGGVDPSIPNVVDNDPWAVMNMREFDEHNEPSKLKLSKHASENSSVKHWTTVYDQYFHNSQATKQRQQFGTAAEGGLNHTTNSITDISSANGTITAIANTTNTTTINITNTTDATIPVNNSTITTIYYGHDASRGFQIGNDTVGLDSGCVYGRQLTTIEIKSKNVTQIDCTGRTYKKKKHGDNDDDDDSDDKKDDGHTEENKSAIQEPSNDKKQHSGDSDGNNNNNS